MPHTPTKVNDGTSLVVPGGTEVTTSLQHVLPATSVLPSNPTLVTGPSNPAALLTGLVPAPNLLPTRKTNTQLRQFYKTLL